MTRFHEKGQATAQIYGDCLNPSAIHVHACMWTLRWSSMSNLPQIWSCNKEILLMQNHRWQLAQWSSLYRLASDTCNIRVPWLSVFLWSFHTVLHDAKHAAWCMYWNVGLFRYLQLAGDGTSSKTWLWPHITGAYALTLLLGSLARQVLDLPNEREPCNLSGQ